MDDLVPLICFSFIHPHISFFSYCPLAARDEIGKNLSLEGISIHIRWSFMKCDLPDQRKCFDDSWPPVRGDYVVGNPNARVAVVTLASLFQV